MGPVLPVSRLAIFSTSVVDASRNWVSPASSCDTGTATQVRVPAVSVPLVDPVLVVWVAGRVFQVADSVQPDGAVKTSTTVLAVSVGVRHSLAPVATDPAGTAGVRNASRPWVLPESQTTLELP